MVSCSLSRGYLVKQVHISVLTPMMGYGVESSPPPAPPLLQELQFLFIVSFKI